MLVVSSEDMESAMFSSIMEAMKAIGMRERVIRYMRNNGRDFVRFEGESIQVFLIKLSLAHISDGTSPDYHDLMRLHSACRCL